MYEAYVVQSIEMKSLESWISVGCQRRDELGEPLRIGMMRRP